MSRPARALAGAVLLLPVTLAATDTPVPPTPVLRVIQPTPAAVDDDRGEARILRAAGRAARATRPQPSLPLRVLAPAPRPAARTRRPAPTRPAPTGPAPLRATRPAAPAGGPVETAVTFALTQVGRPYRWAAAGPAAYDCSGLIVAAYARLGLHLPHQTGALIARGRPVSRAELRRGDIVFPQPGHVAIYLGGGLIVHAPHPGDHVRVAPLYAFWSARRVTG